MTISNNLGIKEEESRLFIYNDIYKETQVLETHNISTGLFSEVYLITTDKGTEVIRFQADGVIAEATVLDLWRGKGAPVAETIAVGKLDDRAYIRLNPVLHGNDLALPATHYLRSGELSRETIQIYTLEQLAKMHQCVTTGFGLFSDQTGPGYECNTWSEYVAQYLQSRGSFLTGELGIDDSTLEKLNILATKNYPTESVFCNGDYSANNLLVTQIKPLSGVFIDPRPIKSHPYYDLSMLVNGIEAATGQQLDLESDPRFKAYSVGANHGKYDMELMNLYRTFTILEQLNISRIRGAETMYYSYEKLLKELLESLH